MEKTGFCCRPYKCLLPCQLFDLTCTGADGEIFILEMQRMNLLDRLFTIQAQDGIKTGFSKRRRLRMIS